MAGVDRADDRLTVDAARIERRWHADGNKGSRVGYIGLLLVGSDESRHSLDLSF